MGAVLLPRHLCAMCVCAHVCMRQGKQDRVFSCTDLHLCCACLCMCLTAAMIVYAQICLSCVWTYVCVCSSAQMPQGRYPASNKDFWGANLRGGQPEDWQGHEVQSTGSQVLCFSDLRTLRYTTVCVLLGIERCWCHVISIVSFLKYNMHVCVCFLSHTQTQVFYPCSEPDLGWCHMQLLRGWQTVSAPQHEALWSPCQADWQVNDTNESQPSLPLGARHWVTASKQPERASLNLKVISF